MFAWFDVIVGMFDVMCAGVAVMFVGLMLFLPVLLLLGCLGFMFAVRVYI